MDLSDKELELVKKLAEIVVERKKNNQGSKREIKERIIKELIGDKISSRRVNVRWTELFNDKNCPVCKGKLKKEDEEYKCDKCEFMLPVELLDKAMEEHKKEIELEDRQYAVEDKLGKLNSSAEAKFELSKLVLERAQKLIEKKDEEP